MKRRCQPWLNNIVVLVCPFQVGRSDPMSLSCPFRKPEASSSFFNKRDLSIKLASLRLLLWNPVQFPLPGEQVVSTCLIAKDRSARPLLHHAEICKLLNQCRRLLLHIHLRGFSRLLLSVIQISIPQYMAHDDWNRSPQSIHPIDNLRSLASLLFQ